MKFRHAFFLAPIALITAGVATIFWPAAFIVAGVLLTPWMILSEVKRDAGT